MTLLEKSTTCNEDTVLSINLTSIAKRKPMCAWSTHFMPVKWNNISCGENGQFASHDQTTCTVKNFIVKLHVFHIILHPTFEELFWEEAGPATIKNNVIMHSWCSISMPSTGWQPAWLFKISNCHNSNYNSTYFTIKSAETTVWNHPPLPECSQTLPAHCHFLSPVVPGRS